MTWEVEYTDEFGDWYQELTESEQDSIDRNVYLLEQFGPALPDRFSTVLYAFDPRRVVCFSSAATKPGMTDGTKNSCQEQINFTNSTCEN